MILGEVSRGSQAKLFEVKVTGLEVILSGLGSPETKLNSV